MEPGDGPAGNRNKEHREYREPSGLVVQVRQVGQGQLGDGQAAGHHHGEDAHRHKDQGKAKNRVHLPDQFVDRQNGGEDVVDKHHPHPQRHASGETGHLGQDPGRAHNEHRPHHHHQNNGEAPHKLLHARAQVAAGDLGDALPLVLDGEHARKIVVHAAREDGAQHNPQKSHRPPHGACHRPEDRAQSGDVKELDEKDLPPGHDHVIHAIGHGKGRGLAGIVHPEHPFHHPGIKNVAQDESKNRKKKGDHGRAF